MLYLKWRGDIIINRHFTEKCATSSATKIPSRISSTPFFPAAASRTCAAVAGARDRALRGHAAVLLDLRLLAVVNTRGLARFLAFDGCRLHALRVALLIQLGSTGLLDRHRFTLRGALVLRNELASGSLGEEQPTAIVQLGRGVIDVHVNVKADVELDVYVHVDVKATDPERYRGFIREAKFGEIAKEAESKCPVSNAYRGSLNISLETRVA